MCLVVFLNIPFARQVICFFYLTFVPGIILINVFKPDKLDTAEKVLLSVGLSVSFLMLIGLILNQIGPSLGISQPLSIGPLVAAVNITIFVLALWNLAKKNRIQFPIISSLRFPIWGLLIAVLPILSIIGAVFVNTSENSSVLLLMIFLTSVFYSLGIINKTLRSSRLYSWTILMVSISLLFYSSLVSNYIHGADIHVEYYIFRQTQMNLHWDPNLFFANLDYARNNAMLSVTILPTVYSNVLQIDGTWTLKLIFPLLFSFAPLGMYKLWQGYFGRKIAFISVLLLMSEMGFYMALVTLAREMIGELFFILLLFVLLSKKIKPRFRTVCFLIFSFSLVVSHYSMALVFLSVIFLAWTLVYIKKKGFMMLDLSLILIFFSIMFSWYIYSSGSVTFDSISRFGENVYGGLRDFFNPVSRGTEVLRGVGLESTLQSAPIGVWQAASRFFAYAVQFFIVLGFVALLFGRTKRKVSFECVAIVLTGMVLLGLCILLPKFALSLQMDRLYHISLYLLAPMFALGCYVAARSVLRQNAKWLPSVLVLTVLVPYFLFQTGFVYEITNQKSWSVPLSIHRMGVRPYTTEFCFVQQEDIFGATWLSNNLAKNSTRIYSDDPSVYNVLSSYGMIVRNVGGYVGVREEVLWNGTEVLPNGTVFLTKMNVENGLFGYGSGFFNWSDISPVLNFTNKVYTNGFSEIYKKP
jgi:uncharacterized membrane protein